MKIVSLQAENIKRLVAVEIAPDGNLVQITGRNAQGKTSVLDSIWWALAGASNVQSAPIRKGADTARIRLDLGEIVVTRTFTKAKDGDKVTTSLTVENADGARFPSPQKMLDDLLGELSFDPLAFARMPAKDQLAALRRFVPDVDFEAIEAANKGDYDKRRDTNREAKALRAQLDALKIPGDPRQERVDESALVQQLEEAGEHNADIERRKANRAKATADAERLEAEVKQHRARADDLRRQALEAEQAAEQAQAAADELRRKLARAGDLPEPIDTAEIREQIAKARETNRAVEERERVIERRKKLEDELKQAEARSYALTKALADRADQVKAAIAAAKLPVDGLSFSEDAVLYNGLPLEQASDAEQLRISVAIAAAMNPKLRVIRIRDGSLLDDDGLRLLAEMAEAQDLQVWLEKVDSSGKVGFVIEDGALKTVEAEGAAA